MFAIGIAVLKFVVSAKFVVGLVAGGLLGIARIKGAVSAAVAEAKKI